jgi:pentatricopeptide repeat protein
MDEALAAHIRAQELDPLTPLHTAWLGGLYWYWGRNEEALEEVQKALELSPYAWHGLFVLAHIYIDLGRYEEAIAVAQKAAARYPNLNYILGCAYAAAGRTEEALQILDELEKENPRPFEAYGLAEFYTCLGNKNEAFRWLNYEPAHCWIPWLRVHPTFKSLKGDPRFDELLVKMNLPPLDN